MPFPSFPRPVYQPLPPFSEADAAAVRQALDDDARTPASAWRAATGNAAAVIRLVRAGIPNDAQALVADATAGGRAYPQPRDPNDAWLQRWLSDDYWKQPQALEGVCAWVQSLPSTPAGQAWLNQALCLAAKDPNGQREGVVHLLLTAGADPMMQMAWKEPSQQHSLAYELLSQLPIDGHDPAHSLTLLVERGVDLNAVFRTEAPRMHPRGAGFLQELEALGLTLHDPSVARHLANGCTYLSVLLDAEATTVGRETLDYILAQCPAVDGHPSVLNYPDAAGRTVLHQFFSSNSVPPDSLKDGYEARIIDGFEQLVAGGADLTALNGDGETPLHTALEHPRLWPTAIIARLMDANPEALTTPFAGERETPLRRLKRLHADMHASSIHGTLAARRPREAACLDALVGLVDAWQQKRAMGQSLPEAQRVQRSRPRF